MPLKTRLSREEKGKAVAISPDPTKDITANGSPLDDFDLVHRDAMRDTTNMTMARRLLIADAHRQIREERASSEVNDVGSGREDIVSSQEALKVIVQERRLRPRGLRGESTEGFVLID